MMPLILAIVSVILAALSLFGALAPNSLVAWVRRFMAGRHGLTFAIVVRVLLAALLWFNAPDSQTPTVFRVLAIITLLAAVVLSVVGIERLRKLIDHVAGWPRWMLRLVCMLGAAFAMFLLWSIWPAL